MYQNNAELHVSRELSEVWARFTCQEWRRRPAKSDGDGDIVQISRTAAWPAGVSSLPEAQTCKVASLYYL